MSLVLIGKNEMVRYILNAKEIKGAKTFHGLNVSDDENLILAQARRLVSKIEETCKNQKHRDISKARKDCRDCWNDLLDQVRL